VNAPAGTPRAVVERINTEVADFPVRADFEDR
jgi:hypothetical protein